MADAVRVDIPVGVARDTLRAIRGLTAAEPLIYLPSHDPESAARLAAGQAVSLAHAA